MLTGLSGPDVSVAGGDVHDCPDDEAIRHIEAGHAVPYVDAAKEKTVKKGPAETR